jgi:hypothetical protein
MALVKDEDVEEFGLNQILEHLIPDLCKLESECIEVNNIGRLRGTIAFVCGDSLGQNQLGGFIERFSSKAQHCRYCLYKTPNEFDPHDISIAELRTKDNYAIDVAKAHATGVYSRGIKHESVLNELINYYVTSGLPSCLGHDFFQGVVSRDLHLIPRVFVKNKVLTKDFWNRSHKQITLKSKSNIKFAKVSLYKKKITGTITEMRNLITCLFLILVNEAISENCQNVRQFMTTMIELTRIITRHEVNMEKTAHLHQSFLIIMISVSFAFPVQI